MGHDSGQRSPDDTYDSHYETRDNGRPAKIEGLSAECMSETLRIIILFPYNLKLNDFCGCNYVVK
jgi:hypothetical protein